MKALAANFEGVWKAYPRWLPGRRSVRAMATPGIRALSRHRGTRWALRDINLEVTQGEAVGLIGRNGAGKSTLLRLSSGLGRITRGTIGVSPNVASVLTLGSALDDELTGRENALTATLLSGVRMAAAQRDVVDALAFAELEEFADSPVRSYSDGMRLRLAFGVVAQLQPELLLLDEVIAVGDLRFREKCMERINERREAGMGLIFASHDLDQIAEECDRAVWLDQGGVRGVGPADEIVERYRESMRSETFDRTPPPAAEESEGLVLQTNRFGSQELTIEEVRVGSELGPGLVEPGGTLRVDFTLRRRGPRIPQVVASVSVYRVGSDIPASEASTDMDQVELDAPDGDRHLAFRWDELELLPGKYVVDVGVYEAGWAFAYDYHWHVYELEVVGADAPEAIFRPRLRHWHVDGG